jgi:succinate dehydrogenase / fumarate reductase, membrane anchor subunit
MRVATGYGSRSSGGGFETFSWYFFRVSGILLLFLALIHIFLNHVATDVSCTSYQLVAIRYQNPFWRLYDWLLLTLALLHGMNGLRVIVDDYVRTRGWRLTLQSAVGIVTLVFFLLGTITLITFQPVVGALGPNCIK